MRSVVADPVSGLADHQLHDLCIGPREKVNGVLALEVMGFAILLALTFYALSRRTAGRAALFQRESAELRALNVALAARNSRA